MSRTIGVNSQRSGVFLASAMFALAACGGRGRAPVAPGPALPPVIAREVVPDPVPTIDPVCDQDFSVTESRPVSATTIAHYYIENGGLVYLVFLRGEPGWYDQLENWQVPPRPPGQYVQMASIAGFRHDLSLDIASRSLNILDQRIDLKRTNVVFLDRVANAVVPRGGTLMNLCWSSPPDAPGQVLSRSRDAASFVVGKASPVKKAAPPRKRSTPARKPATKR